MQSSSSSWEQAVKSLSERPECSAIVRDCYYDQPLLEAARRYVGSGEWQEVLKLLPVIPGHVVDLGAGNGITTHALASAGWTVTAIEPDPGDLVGRAAIANLARQSCMDRQIKVQAGFGEAIPVADAAADLVFARQVFHHARDLGQFCREAFRALKPGGMLLTLRDHVISRRSDLPAFLAQHPLHAAYGGENAFRTAEYSKALRDAGFRIVRVIRSFDSVLNYYPHTRSTLRSAILNRAGRVLLLSAVLRPILANEGVFSLFLSLMSRMDGRPGRLVSFVCSKPE